MELPTQYVLYCWCCKLVLTINSVSMEGVANDVCPRCGDMLLIGKIVQPDGGQLVRPPEAEDRLAE